jgi:WD40 repeat protein
VRVWDCVGEGATKGEYHIISGRINDIAWDGDSQRIIAVGDGRQRYGHAITADSGNSVGEISGHSAQINAVSIKQQRPLRAATAGDDKSMVFYHGAPFKFNAALRGNHSNYIYGVEFSPDGNSLVTVGADRKITLYDGKTGEVKGDIGAGEHKGSIFGVSWAQDSRRFVTSSADRTVKVWDVEAGKPVQSWDMGDEGQVSIPHHQVGVVWPGGRSDDLIISLSLSGDLNYLVEGKEKPTRVIHGHQKNITAAGMVDTGEKNSTFWSGSYDGRIYAWDVGAGICEPVDGDGHPSYVAGITATSEGQGRIYSVGWDDTLRSIDASARTYTGSVTKLAGQPKSVAGTGTKVFVAREEGVDVFEDGQKTGELKCKFTPSAVAALGTLVAVGSSDNIVRLFDLSQKDEPLAEIKESRSATTCLAFSPDASLLAYGDTLGKIIVYDVRERTIFTTKWAGHTARITSIAWNQDGGLAASGSLDTHVHVWSVADPAARVRAMNAHKDGVSGVAWVPGESKVVSAGADAAVKVWKVEGLT